MKTHFLLFVFLIYSMSFAQNNYTVKTEYGRRDLLKADFIWEYIYAAQVVTITETQNAN
mgnify:CR=1 FL=1